MTIMLTISEARKIIDQILLKNEKKIAKLKSNLKSLRKASEKTKNGEIIQMLQNLKKIDEVDERVINLAVSRIEQQSAVIGVLKEIRDGE